MYGSMAVVGEFAPFIQFCFLACYVAFVLTKPGIREWLLVTAAGAVLGLDFARLHVSPWISGMGLATALWAVLAPLFRRKTVHPAVAMLVLYPTLAYAAVIAINRGGGLVLDRYILAADGNFGFQPGAAAAFIYVAARRLPPQGLENSAILNPETQLGAVVRLPTGEYQRAGLAPPEKNEDQLRAGNFAAVVLTKATDDARIQAVRSGGLYSRSAETRNYVIFWKSKVMQGAP